MPNIIRELFTLLSSGGKYSDTDIMQRLNISNPKNVIKDLRRMGIEVKEELTHAIPGGTYIKYWINF